MSEATSGPLFPGLVASDRLFAAAPDLLAALESLSGLLDEALSVGHADQTTRQIAKLKAIADAAIAKAKGI